MEDSMLDVPKDKPVTNKLDTKVVPTQPVKRTPAEPTIEDLRHIVADIKGQVAELSDQVDHINQICKDFADCFMTQDQFNDKLAPIVQQHDQEIAAISRELSLRRGR